MEGLKRFFTNKNVVTIILVIVALGLLFWGYNYTIKKETNPISVPVAAVNIGPRTKITSDKITYKTVAGSMVDENVLKNISYIQNRYTNINVTIPQGSMFYSNWVVNGDDIPGNWIEELDRNKELGYYMSVNYSDTLGNSILPDSYVDLYMKIIDDNGYIMIGKLMKNMKVLVVHDSNGKNVFDDSSNVGYPSKLGFALSPDYFILLKKAEYLGIDTFLQPRGTKEPVCTDKENCMIVGSSVLQDYINARTVTAEDDIKDEDILEQYNNQNNTDDNGQIIVE